MFDLSEADLNARLFEYGCGPSAFNAECHQQGRSVISCDSLFSEDLLSLKQKVSSIVEDRVAGIKKTPELFDFRHYGSLDAFIAYRRHGIDDFFEDYEQGLAEGRYVHKDLKALPFADFSFDLALSAHDLFGDSVVPEVAVHLQVIRDLARIAKELRIFPLIDSNGEPSPLLGPVLLGLQQEQYGVEVREVNDSLQPKGNAMLRVWAQQCQLA